MYLQTFGRNSCFFAIGVLFVLPTWHRRSWNPGTKSCTKILTAGIDGSKMFI